MRHASIDNKLLAGVLGALMIVGCTGDDNETMGSATDSDTSTVTDPTATSTATTTAGSASATDSTTTMGGSMSESNSGSSTTTGETDSTSASATDGTDSSTTMMATDSSTTGDPGICGDGQLDPGEQCDDGNNEDGDGCEADCTLPPEPTCPDEMSAIKCDGNTNNWYQAMELGCSDNPDESIVIMDESLTSSNPNAWRIAKGFGTYMQMGELLYSPRGGESFLMVSTGVISQPNGQGIVTESNNSQVGNGDNGNDDSNSLPPPINVAKGSNGGAGGTPFVDCDKMGDCSDTLFDAWNLGTGDPNDKLWFTFKTVVPPLVESYSFNFAYFSSEWPTYVNTQFNDLLIAWQTSEAYTGNVTFIGDQPLTVTSLNGYLGSDGYSGNEPQLQGTGFESHAGSDWFGANQNVVAGETLHMTFMIADMGDSILATLAILDNFHWNCEECIPADDDVCKGEVPDPNCCGVIEPQ
ncbi:MAG: choice-of-anchor L domain-containing protein [Myxococcales bacterium]|nr:choice-of-anchor L domain-containing protein [Myxococcales bacterium]